MACGGVTDIDNSAAIQAQKDLTAAYSEAATNSTSPTTVVADLAGLTLYPGRYYSTSTIILSTAVTLDGGGDPNAVFIFQAGSAITTSTNSVVHLQNGAKAANVFWVVGTACTLGTYSTFAGVIMAQTSISILTGAQLEGRALAEVLAPVTLDTNNITNP